ASPVLSGMSSTASSFAQAYGTENERVSTDTPARGSGPPRLRAVTRRRPDTSAAGCPCLGRPTDDSVGPRSHERGVERRCFRPNTPPIPTPLASSSSEPRLAKGREEYGAGGKAGDKILPRAGFK